MKKMLVAMMIVAVAILSGCATKQFQVKDVNLEAGVQTLDFLIEPYESLGVIETNSVKNGDVTVVKGIFPEILFGEYFPGRIRWNVLGTDAFGKEYFGQAIFSGISFTGDFLFTIVLDGAVPADAKVLVLSTGLDFAYDLGAREYSVERSMIADGTYRKGLILANGTRIGDMKRDNDILSIIKRWNRFETPEGTLLSPLGEKELKEIAGINPRYSYSEKLVGSGNFTLVADYIGTGVSLAIDLMRAPNVPSEGWDYNSQVPSRRNMALIIKFVTKLQKSLVDNLNHINAELYSKKGRIP